MRTRELYRKESMLNDMQLTLCFVKVFGLLFAPVFIPLWFLLSLGYSNLIDNAWFSDDFPISLLLF